MTDTLAPPFVQRARDGRFIETDAAERFFSKLVIPDDPPDACWDWLGSKCPKGYGKFWDGSSNTTSHRFSYRLFRGEIPPGKEIDHLCRNTSCQNPEHFECVPKSVNRWRQNDEAAAQAAWEGRDEGEL